MKRLVKKILAQLGYQMQCTRHIPRQMLDPVNLRAVEFDDVVCRHMHEVGPVLSFIQIGAFDGVIQDPLHKYINKFKWRGVLVEPQGRAVRQLRQLYENNDSIVVLHAALDREAGRRTLFTVESENLPPWAGALASFDPAVILKHSNLIPMLDQAIKEVKVDCITFDDVLKLFPTKQLDLLQIDTEGADEYVLSLFPLEVVKPKIIHWEIRHLTKEQREKCLDLLSSFNYRFAFSGTQDMLAVRPGEM